MASFNFIQSYINEGLNQVFCTDISKDGKLEGPSVELYKKIITQFPNLFFVVLLMTAQLLLAQTKVSGVVVDKTNQPIPFATIVFKKTNIGVVANEDGRFYIESPQKHSVLVVSSAGFSEREIYLEEAVVYNFKVKLNEAESLNEVVVFTGKTSKKNNPKTHPPNNAHTARDLFSRNPLKTTHPRTDLRFSLLTFLCICDM